MTTTTDAVSRLAHELGVPEGNVLQIAKALRAAGGDLWPTGGRGGGKLAAHVKVHHLRNLLIGCLVTDLIKDAADRVRRYAAMPSIVTPLSSRKELPPDLAALPFPLYSRKETFGSVIDKLIEAHADPLCHPKLMMLGLRVEVSRTAPAARITAESRPRNADGRVPPERMVAAFRDNADFAALARIPNPLHVRSDVSENVCAACAEMLADTRWRERR